jgi:DNA repair photolyase
MNNPTSFFAFDQNSENKAQDRIFIELAEEGCGIGCRYCYISGPSTPVQPLPMTVIAKNLEDIPERFRYSQGKNGPLLSVGCDTEIGANPAVSGNADLCLAFAAEQRLPLQLATKFPLDDSLVKRLDQWPDDAPTPIVFTTITTITRHREMEPKAPPPLERAHNFKIPRKKWLSYALVKPFGPASISDTGPLLELFTTTQPDGVVVGTQYNRGTAKLSERNEYKEHPYIRNWYSKDPMEEALEFAEKIRENGFEVFLSTRCATAHHNKSDHGLIIHNQYPMLCVKCGSCQGIPQARTGTTH